MEEETLEKTPPENFNNPVPDSPKPFSFTIDFGGGKNVDSQRHKILVEKYQKKHTRGQSLSKIECISQNVEKKKHPSSGNLPRKSSFHSEGYFSSDEKSDKSKNGHGTIKNELTLPLKYVATDICTNSYPMTMLSDIASPKIELKDSLSPELDLTSPIEIYQKNLDDLADPTMSSTSLISNMKGSSSECETQVLLANSLEEENFIDGTEFDFDKSDAVSDTGTYTLDGDNYSEEQKLRMSIDREFKMEHISGTKRTEEYVESLANFTLYEQSNLMTTDITKKIENLEINTANTAQKNEDVSLSVCKDIIQALSQYQSTFKNQNKKLSPILSPTQNTSVMGNSESTVITTNNRTEETLIDSLSKTNFPKSISKQNQGNQIVDHGSVISVTSSGAFRSSRESERNLKILKLTKSEIQVQNYLELSVEDQKLNITKLSTNIVNIQNISEAKKDMIQKGHDSSSAGMMVLGSNNLPPLVGGITGKNSPTKIPSPMHTLSRPRSQCSSSSQNVDLSDSSIETESFLEPTQKYITSLQQKLCLDSNQDSDNDCRYGIPLNNTLHKTLKQKTSHVRHNSSEKTMKISSKVDHFQANNLRSIDQTFSNNFNQYNASKVIQKIQNSPNNSPIRRSSSFSKKNQGATKNTNFHQKESNMKQFSINSPIQRSASTAYMKSNITQRQSSNVDHKKIDRNQFGNTDSSSEEDFEKNLFKKKDMSNMNNTRYNRAFSLRRGRLDSEPTVMNCPNTPEMKRKFQPGHNERAISADRKIRDVEIQCRYMMNISNKTPFITSRVDTTKNSPKPNIPMNKQTPGKPTVLSRTDSGRFSTRSNKSPVAGIQKLNKKDSLVKKSGVRSNSSLTSKEVDFQNWKRRKSYDPMKAAAEGKKKQLAKKQTSMTQSYNGKNQLYDCDSSPSHSSSVHRSQSFHGTAAMEQQISSEEDDMTLSADEGFSPPIRSPCKMSPVRARLRNICKEPSLH